MRAAIRDSVAELELVHCDASLPTGLAFVCNYPALIIIIIIITIIVLLLSSFNTASSNTLCTISVSLPCI